LTLGLGFGSKDETYTESLELGGSRLSAQRDFNLAGVGLASKTWWFGLRIQGFI
jgi:hypothetical protein